MSSMSPREEEFLLRQVPTKKLSYVCVKCGHSQDVRPHYIECSKCGTSIMKCPKCDGAMRTKTSTVLVDLV